MHILKVLKGKLWSPLKEFLEIYFYISYEYANVIQNKSLVLCLNKAIYEKVDYLHGEVKNLTIKDGLLQLTNNYVENAKIRTTQIFKFEI